MPTRVSSNEPVTVPAWSRKPTTVPEPRWTHTVAPGTSMPTSNPMTVVQNHRARCMSATVRDTCDRPSSDRMSHRGTALRPQSQVRRCFFS